MAKIIDGKAISQKIRDSIAEQRSVFTDRYGIRPGLAVIIVGDDPASQIYVNNKAKACDQVGFYSEVHRLSADTTEDELKKLIVSLNSDVKIHGILVQLPIPSHIDEKAIISSISPMKDVDGFSEINTGKMILDYEGLLPCTPAGIMAMLKHEGIDPDGKECVVVGRSNIVGKPIAMLLLRANGTVTVCHSHTKNLKEITKRADILVCAIGKSRFITGDMVKDGAAVIDVGINRDGQGKLSGDVDFDSVAPIASAITPVPGGVGPMTITMLLQNTLNAAEKIMKKSMDK